MGARTAPRAALVVIGDGAGTVGFGLGKAREVQSSIQKANAAARLGQRPGLEELLHAELPGGAPLRIP